MNGEKMCSATMNIDIWLKSWIQTHSRTFPLVNVEGVQWQRWVLRFVIDFLLFVECISYENINGVRDLVTKYIQYIHVRKESHKIIFRKRRSYLQANKTKSKPGRGHCCHRSYFCFSFNSNPNVNINLQAWHTFIRFTFFFVYTERPKGNQFSRISCHF